MVMEPFQKVINEANVTVSRAVSDLARIEGIKVEREGTGFLILHELTYTWRGRPVTGFFCWHERTPTMVIPQKRDFPLGESVV